MRRIRLGKKGDIHHPLKCLTRSVSNLVSSLFLSPYRMTKLSDRSLDDEAFHFTVAMQDSGLRVVTGNVGDYRVLALTYTGQCSYKVYSVDFVTSVIVYCMV
jgi:hypothetical protein